MKTDGNLYALEKHLEEEVREETREECFNQDVCDKLYQLFEDLESRFQEIGEKHGYSDCDLDTFYSRIGKEW